MEWWNGGKNRTVKAHGEMLKLDPMFSAFRLKPNALGPSVNVLFRFGFPLFHYSNIQSFRARGRHHRLLRGL